MNHEFDEETTSPAYADWPQHVDVRTAIIAAASATLAALISGYFDIWGHREQGSARIEFEREQLRSKLLLKVTEYETQAERVTFLRFLKRSRLVADLDLRELKIDDNPQNADAPDTNPIVPGPPGKTLPDIGPAKLTDAYLKDFKDFFSKLKIKNIKPEDLLVLGRRSTKSVSPVYGFNRYPPRELWPNIATIVRTLSEFVKRYKATIEIISAYRSPRYNSSIGGASSSLHLKFQAIDFRVIDKGAAKDWGKLLIKMREEGVFTGGIGIYERSNFIHLDSRSKNSTWRN